ncbi:unnamed protein product [Prunus armeniaca]
MALKAFLLLFVTILLVTAMVSSQDDPEEELKAKSRVRPTTPKAKTPPKARSPPAPKGGKGGKTKPFPKSPPSPALDEPYPPFDEHNDDELTPPLPVIPQFYLVFLK